MSQVTTPLLISIIVPLLLWWLARKFPAPELSDDGPTLEELRPKYRKWEFVFLALYLALWAPVSFALALPLQALARWHAHSLQADAQTLVFTMETVAWWLPAFFLALLLSGLLLNGLGRVLLKERFADYERYNALRHGFDQQRVLKGLVVFVCTGCALFIYIFFDAYVAASPQELRVNPLFGSERRYAYTEIAEVVTAPALIAPNGNTVHRREFLIRFADGSSYSTNYMPKEEIGGRSTAQWVEFILQRSGQELKTKAVFQRGEL